MPNLSCKQKSKVKMLDDNSSNLLRVCWWNGGGAIRSRIGVNPGLNTFLKTNPDMFVYGESGCSNERGFFLSGYRFLFHRSYIEINKSIEEGW